MEKLPLIGNILILGTLFFSIGVLFDHWLFKFRLARKEIIPIFILSYYSVTIKSLWFSDTSWWIMGFFLLFGITIGIHGPDLWTTSFRGRGWWLNP